MSWYANGKNAIVCTPHTPRSPNTLGDCPKTPYDTMPRGPNSRMYTAATTNGGESSGRMPTMRKNGFQRIGVYTIAYAKTKPRTTAVVVESSVTCTE